MSTTKGYYHDKVRGKFLAKITIDGRLIHLGTFNTAREASAAYRKAKDSRPERLTRRQLETRVSALEKNVTLLSNEVKRLHKSIKVHIDRGSDRTDLLERKVAWLRKHAETQMRNRA